jgi:hypothetical protein
MWWWDEEVSDKYVIDCDWMDNGGIRYRSLCECSVSWFRHENSFVLNNSSTKQKYSER